MKKLLYIAAVALVASMAACAGNKEAKEEAAEEAPVVVEEIVAAEVDSCACDSCACDSCTGACGAAEVVEEAAAN